MGPDQLGKSEAIELVVLCEHEASERQTRQGMLPTRGTESGQLRAGQRGRSRIGESRLRIRWNIASRSTMQCRTSEPIGREHRIGTSFYLLPTQPDGSGGLFKPCSAARHEQDLRGCLGRPPSR